MPDVYTTITVPPSSGRVWRPGDTKSPGKPGRGVSTGRPWDTR